jgi:hypothetical protein
MSEETKSGALAEWHQGWGSISFPEMANEWKLELV